MVPSSVATVFAFFLLVAPGIVYQLLRERHRAGYQDSVFREAARVVLASTLFSGASLLVLGVLRALVPAIMPDPGKWLGQGYEYVVSHYELVAFFFIAEAALAISFAVIGALLAAQASKSRKPRGLIRAIKWVSRKIMGGTIDPTSSAWAKVFRKDLPEGFHPHVLVELDNECAYEGLLASFAPELEVADRELTLAPPLRYRAKGDPTFKDLPERWQRVVIPGPSIKALHVAYVPIPPP